MLLLLPSRSAADAAGEDGMKLQQSTAVVAAAVYGRRALLKPSTGVQRCRTAVAGMLDSLLLLKAGKSCVIGTAGGWVRESARGHCVCGPAAAVEAVTRQTLSSTRLRVFKTTQHLIAC
jgi:hypothetical protein